MKKQKIKLIYALLFITITGILTALVCILYLAIEGGIF